MRLHITGAAAGDVRPVATPGTLPHCLQGVGGAPTRRTGRKPKYVQYEDFRPALPPAFGRGDPRSTHRTPLLDGQTLPAAAPAPSLPVSLRLAELVPSR
jgi:hypothetical protein